MPYMVVEDFSLGWDLRKSAVTASAKSLRKLVNGYVNAGGEIEKRRQFVQGVAPGSLAGTHGLGSLGTSLWVFGSGTRPAGLPVQLGYQQLIGSSIYYVLDVDVFDNMFYVVLQTTGGTIEHYYNGVRVADAPPAPTVMAHRSKMYAVLNNIVYFSALNNPAAWTPTSGSTNIGAGFIQLDGQDEGAITLIGLAPYYDQLALFGRNSVQLWAMDEDPAQNQLISTVGGTGLVAFKALGRYATGDVLYLHDSGVRSLKARDSSNAAVVADIGSPIDDELRALVAAARRASASGGAVPDSLLLSVGINEPSTGQFWLVINDRIYVLSIASSSNISAWSRFDLPFVAQYAVEVAEAVALRAGNDLYFYGTAQWEGYDTAQIEVITPMIAGNEPATAKLFYGLDAALEGTWRIEVGTDPAQPDVRELVATVTGPTFGLQNLGLQNEGTHITARLTCSDASRARIGNLLFHYNKGVSD